MRLVHVRRQPLVRSPLTHAAVAPTPQGDAALRTLKEFEAGLQLPQPSKVGLSVTHHVVQNDTLTRSSPTAAYHRRCERSLKATERK